MNKPHTKDFFSPSQLIHPKIHQEMVSTFLSMTPTQKAIMELLVFLSGVFKRVTPSQATIAAKLGKKRETINRLIAGIPRFMVRRLRIRDAKLTRYETKRGWRYYKKDRYIEYTIDPVWKMVYEQSKLRSVFRRLEGLTPHFLKDIASLSKKTFLNLRNGSYFSQKCHTIQGGIFNRIRNNKGSEIITNKERVIPRTREECKTPDDILAYLLQRDREKRTGSITPA